MRSPTTALMAAFMAAVIAACAGPGPKPATPAETVSERAQARWDALLEKRWAEAYKYFTPGHRSIEDKSAFQFRMDGKRVQWTEARVLGAECPEPRVCKVEVEVDYMMRKPMRGVDEHRGSDRWEETWLRSEQGWFYRPKT